MSSSCAFEDVMLAAYMFPKGLGLFMIDPVSGRSTGPFSTPLYREIMNQDFNLFRARGVESITQNVVTADRTLCDIYVIEAIKHQPVDCVLICRILRPNSSQYRWVRQWTLPGMLPNRIVTLSACCDLFETQAERILSTLVEQTSSLMLACVAQKSFDCCLWADERMRILSDTVKCRKWLYGDPNRSLLKSPLESFIPLDQNKLALREYVKSRSGNGPLEAKPIRLRMNIANRPLVETDVFVFPFVTGTKPIRYIVALRLVEILTSSLIRAPRISAAAIQHHEPPPVAADNGVGEIYRGILRDWNEAINDCERIRNWIIPVERMSGFESMSDFLLMALPPHIQGDFREAAERGDYHSCCQMLSFTIYGDANIMSPQGARSTNTDLLHCTFKFLLSFVPKLRSDPARQFSLLSLLQDCQRHVLIRRLDSQLYTSTVYRFALVLLSTAVSNPNYYSREIALKWIRSTFADTLNLPVNDIQPNLDRKLLIVYWICLLWAGAMYSMNNQRKTQEAVAVLKTVVSELTSFRKRIPMSPLVNQILFVALRNLTKSEDTVISKTEKRKYLSQLENDVIYSPLIDRLNR